MDILEKNLNINENLRKIYEKVKDQLYPVEKTKNNLWTLKINNIYFHSKYEPDKEAERIIDTLLNNNETYDIYILYGNGLGYILRNLYDKILKNNNSSIKPYILYIEYDIKLFLTSLKYFDWTDILSCENVKFFFESEKEVIGSFIQNIPSKRIKYFYHRPSYNLNSDYYKEVQNYISYIIQRKDMNYATFKRFQKLWTKNSLLNLPYFLGSNTLIDIVNIAKGATSLVIAAGPTLVKSLDFIKKVQDYVIIIAVDTSYKFLLKNNIKVDIIATIDPQYWNYKYLEDIKINNEIIVTDITTYYKIFQLTKPNRIFTGNSIFPIGKYFENNKDRGTIGAGGSVATTAFDTARLIGSDVIILLGLDLSYPGRETHFKGAFFESNFITTATYFKTTEDNVYRYLTHVPLYPVESTNKTKVFSDSKMFIFKKWFDREIPLSKAKVYQPNLGGVLLEGTIIKEIYELEKLITNFNKDIYFKNINTILNKSNKFNWNDIVSKINNFINSTEKIKNLYLKIIKLIPENGKVDIKDQITIEKIENQINNDNNLSEVIKIVSSGAQDIINSIIENVEYSENEVESSWIKTKLLYNSIIDLIDIYNKYFNKILKIITNNPNIVM